MHIKFQFTSEKNYCGVFAAESSEVDPLLFLDHSFLASMELMMATDFLESPFDIIKYGLILAAPLLLGGILNFGCKVKRRNARPVDGADTPRRNIIPTEAEPSTKSMGRHLESTPKSVKSEAVISEVAEPEVARSEDAKPESVKTKRVKSKREKSKSTKSKSSMSSIKKLFKNPTKVSLSLKVHGIVIADLLFG